MIVTIPLRILYITALNRTYSTLLCYLCQGHLQVLSFPDHDLPHQVAAPSPSRKDQSEGLEILPSNLDNQAAKPA